MESLRIGEFITDQLLAAIKLAHGIVPTTMPNFFKEDDGSTTWIVQVKNYVYLWKE